MDNEENNNKEEFTSAKILFRHNQQEIIQRKEGYYDKIIDSLHLARTKIDILILVLLGILVWIFLSGMRS